MQVACPKCDALYDLNTLQAGQTLRCTRCHTTLIAKQQFAGLTIIGTSLCASILVVGALFAPFLEVRKFGLGKVSTLVDVMFAFPTGPQLGLTALLLGLVIALPLTRLCLTLYALTPVVLKIPHWPGAKRAFHLSEGLRPWSMAEVFLVGAGLSLIKLSDFAHVHLGPAFWMLAAAAILLGLQNIMMCRWSVWSALNQ